MPSLNRAVQTETLNPRSSYSTHNECDVLCELALNVFMVREDQGKERHFTDRIVTTTPMCTKDGTISMGHITGSPRRFAEFGKLLLEVV
jgi:hypothetical protein